MSKYKLVCRSCKKEIEADTGDYRCGECGGALDVVFAPGISERLIKAFNQHKQFWDFIGMLPVGNSSVKITLGEGITPTVSAVNLRKKANVKQLYIKNEALNPTGTFKDRCMAVALTQALEKGAPAVILGSAGNAASAAAAYAAKACIPCYVLVPEGTPVERVAQTALYGAKVMLVRGTVNDCIDLITDLCEKRGWHNVTTASVHNPYQAEAPKTISYEICACLNGEVPDWILVPIGGGGILTAMWKGFCELRDAGIIHRLPKMVGTQADGCAAVVKAFKEKKAPHEIVSWGKPETIAAAIADPYPLDGETALKAIYSSNGYAEEVSDSEILEAQRLLASSEGIFAEPASSTTIAGLLKLRRKNVIGAQETAACVITGTGMKDPRLALLNIKTPVVIEKDILQLQNAIGQMSQKGKY